MWPLRGCIFPIFPVQRTGSLSCNLATEFCLHAAGGIYVRQTFTNSGGKIEISGSSAKHGGAVLRSFSGIGLVTASSAAQNPLKFQHFPACHGPQATGFIRRGSQKLLPIGIEPSNKLRWWITKSVINVTPARLYFPNISGPAYW